MAKASDQFQPGDVTFWGILALCAWAIALVAGSLSALLPEGVLGGLHTSRLGGADLNQLRGQIAALQAQAAKLRDQNAALLQRADLSQQQGGDLARRVGALELTLPRILESLNDGTAGVDRSAITATAGRPVTTVDADGGTVSYTTTPLPGIAGAPAASDEQPMPQSLNATSLPQSGGFGIALGPPVDAGAASAAWQGINDRIGTLLVGLRPVLGHVEGGAGRRVIAGPIASEADARDLCGRMADMGIACQAVPFAGDPLSPPN